MKLTYKELILKFIVFYFIKMKMNKKIILKNHWNISIDIFKKLIDHFFYFLFFFFPYPSYNPPLNNLSTFFFYS